MAKAGRTTLLVLGGSDSGKTTFCRGLADQLLASGKSVSYLDLDAGQASLGPPATFGLVRWRPDHAPIAPTGFFLGETTPYPRAARALAGVALLAAKVPAGNMLIVDTSGVAPGHIGLELALDTARALTPTRIVLLERENELGELSAALGPLCPSVDRTPVSEHARRRSPEQRARYRRDRFAAYFSRARSWHLSLDQLASIPPGTRWEDLPPGQLLGLSDDRGLLQAIALLEQTHPETITVFGPPVDQARMLEIGDLVLDKNGEQLGRNRV